MIHCSVVKILLSALCLASFCVSSQADSRPRLPSRGIIQTRPPQRAQSPLVEARALWVVRSSITSPAKIANVVRDAKLAGYNMLFVQVRGRGDAYYNSTLEPRAEELSGQPASFDPLQTTINLAHASGLQVHAWINTDLIWSGTKHPLSKNHIFNAHPDWIARTQTGLFSTTANSECEGAFLSPAIPAVRIHNHDVFLEIARKYQIDGIHFDYVRYPNLGYDYSPTALSLFVTDLAKTGMKTPAPTAKMSELIAFAKNHPQEWQMWRRDRLTDMVESIAADIHNLHRNIVVSAAVFSDWNDAYKTRGQDWKRWLKDGALDMVVPMAYSSSTTVFARQIREAQAAASESGKICIAGIGSWHISAASTCAKIDAARAIGASGFGVFSYGGVTKDGRSAAYLKSIALSELRDPADPPSEHRMASMPKNAHDIEANQQ
jgi:uncharacterized lipoprotein YddW (UPF0748 family)